MKRKNVAVVGIGWFGRAHARNYLAMANLVAVCDLNAEAARKFAEEHPGVNAYTSVEDMVTNESLDAASVVTPPSQVPNLTKRLVDAGVDVLVEKPLGLSVDEVREANRAAEEVGVRVQPGFIELYNPVVDEVDRLVAAGEVGEIITISSTRIGLYPRRHWGMGVLLDLGIHDVYLQQHFLGEVRRLHAMTCHHHSERFEDAAFLLLDFGKVKTMIESNWLTPTKFRKMTIAGSEGSVEVDFVTKSLKVIHGRALDTDHPETVETIVTPLRAPEPLAREIANFLYEDRPKVTMAEGIAALDVVLRAMGNR
ncbi:MAG: Gfo/Idh/MocA family oxidoreductase [Promethearchaeota archaeon]